MLIRHVIRTAVLILAACTLCSMTGWSSGGALVSARPASLQDGVHDVHATQMNDLERHRRSLLVGPPSLSSLCLSCAFWCTREHVCGLSWMKTKHTSQCYVPCQGFQSHEPYEAPLRARSTVLASF